MSKAKIPFTTAVKGYVVAQFGAKGPYTAASRAAGKSDTWFASMIRSKGFTSKTVETLYKIFPELEAAVKAGTVEPPPRIKRSRRAKVVAAAAPLQQEMVLEADPTEIYARILATSLRGLEEGIVRRAVSLAFPQRGV